MVLRPMYLSHAAVMVRQDFDPRNVPGLVALYDISDLSTLFVERTGASATTPASVDGVVGTVLDLSGNGNHMVARSDAARPLLKQSGSLYYLEGDGVDDTMNSAGFVAVETNKAIASAFSISTAGGSSGQQPVFEVSQAANVHFGFRFRRQTAARIAGAQLRNSSDLFSALGSNPSFAFEDLLACYAEHIGGSLNFNVRGDQTLDLSVSADLGGASTAGAASTLFSNDGAIIHFYAGAVFDPALSADNRDKLLEWLLGTMGVPSV